MPELLTPRWTQLREHREQSLLVLSRARFKTADCGRRSGKSERGKRHLVECAMQHCHSPSGLYVYAAPTNDQARDIAWQDLKDLVPDWAQARPPSEVRPTIYLRNDVRIRVVGLDKPQRIEGQPLDGIVVDEMSDMRPGTWERHIRPMLYTEGREPGWAWLIGVPRITGVGGGAYKKLCQRARTGADAHWANFHWKSDTILPADELEQAKADLDPKTYEQEYEASWVSFGNTCYYAFDEQQHAFEAVEYDRHRDLIFTMDFGKNPAVAAVGQRQEYQGNRSEVAPEVVAWLDEIYLTEATTEQVVNEFCARWGHHQRRVLYCGDPAGGNPTATTEYSDWDVVRTILNAKFRNRLIDRVPGAHPFQNQRVSATNAMFRNAAGAVRMLVDPVKCPELVRDWQEVVWKEGTSYGKIDKDRDHSRTHLSDSVDYYVWEEHRPDGSNVAHVTGIG